MTEPDLHVSVFQSKEATNTCTHIVVTFPSVSWTTTWCSTLLTLLLIYIHSCFKCTYSIGTFKMSCPLISSAEAVSASAAAVTAKTVLPQTSRGQTAAEDETSGCDRPGGRGKGCSELQQTQSGSEGHREHDRSQNWSRCVVISQWYTNLYCHVTTVTSVCLQHAGRGERNSSVVVISQRGKENIRRT